MLTTLFLHSELWCSKLNCSVMTEEESVMQV